LKLAFLGTPEFAVPTLVHLHKAGHSIRLVLSQPDRPAGRGLRTRACAVKEQALSLGLTVIQPEALNARVQAQVAAQEVDVAVVVAYGLLLPREFLRIPRRGCVNVHASLLPRFRGASPVSHAILRGESAVGVTTLLMDEGIDTGPILLQRETPLGDRETAGEVELRLSLLGAELLLETLEGLERGTLLPCPQVVDVESYAPKIRQEAARISWDADATAISRQIRALNPRPGAFTSYRGTNVKIWLADPSRDPTGEGTVPGTLQGDRRGLRVTCGMGTCLEVRQIQLEGRRRVSGEEAMRGRWFEPGDRFGDGRQEGKLARMPE
jgi:methionyl-tRNA formyltransferase